MNEMNSFYDNNVPDDYFLPIEYLNFAGHRNFTGYAPNNMTHQDVWLSRY